MNALVQLRLAVLTCVSMSLAVLRLLSRPLARVLAHICPDEATPEFWLSYTQVRLTIAPLLATPLVDRFTGVDQSVTTIRLTVVAALVGLLLGLYALGRRLGQFVRLPDASSAGLEGRS